MAARMFGVMICLLLMSVSVGWGADATRITQLAGKVHIDLQSMIKVQKLKLPEAVRQQKTFLLKQPEVLDVKELKGNNLMVKFKDGNELLMLMGEDRMGSVQTTATVAGGNVIKPVNPAITQIDPSVLVALLPCAPKSNKASDFRLSGR